ncbi:MAG: EamA family transporter [candidate division Zixibacteria bacterium]|nr:EamA family transporter [candidate division Zixibacteria bacterium]
MQVNYAFSILFLAMLSVGWAAIFIRWCDGIDPLLISFYRMAWATALLLPVSLIRAKKIFIGISRRDFLMMVFIGFILALHFGTWISSLFYTTVASSTVLVTTQPIFLVLFSMLFTSEKVRGTSILAILLALSGAIVIGLGDLRFTGDYIKGDLLAIAGAVCVAIYLFLGRQVRQRVANLAYVQIVYASSALFLLAGVLIFSDFSYDFPLRQHIWLLCLGLIPTVLGHTLYSWALKQMRAYLVGTSILGEPVGASFYAWLIFKEIPPETTIYGALLIFAGVVTLFYSERKNIA